MVLEGVRFGEERSLFENLTVINFNYDRSLEQYLFLGLQEFGGLTEEQAADELSRLEVVRPYGSLGMLPWQQSDGIAYGSSSESNNVLRAALSIRTYTEGIRGLDLQRKIASVMEAAR